MGRHGGGSRSGGSRSRSRSSSRRSSSGGSSSHVMKKRPFSGCYNRSYYDSRGVYHKVYTNNVLFGTPSYCNSSALLMSTILHLFACSLLIITFIVLTVNVGTKVNGDASKIRIVDNVDCMSNKEEAALLQVLSEVYEKSGMPVCVYTSDFSYKEHYLSIEAYSEDLYREYFNDLNSMLVCYTEETVDGFDDWNFDVFCEDGTYACLNDVTFDKLIDTMHNGFYDGNVAETIAQSFNIIKPDLATTTIDWYLLPVLLLFLCTICRSYLTEVFNFIKNKQAVCYFNNNPEKFGKKKMLIHSNCPNCGAPNTKGLEYCKYCDSLLVAETSEVKYV